MGCLQLPIEAGDILYTWGCTSLSHVRCVKDNDLVFLNSYYGVIQVRMDNLLQRRFGNIRSSFYEDLLELI